ncbi:hypothetical protein HY570_00910 [Candidatus Micrarchaeota archaeon]|nr:hypothetical protein [Candidatus Micrarchaeota archaeon]
MGEARTIFRHAIQAYLRNIQLITFFSIPSLLSLLIPLLTPYPTYVSIGATFLRTGSMPELTTIDQIIITSIFLISLFLLSFAIVSINLVIKSQRTLTKIKDEVMKGIETYTFNVFFLYVVASLVILILTLISFEYTIQPLVMPIAIFIISLFLFYAPAAVVIDDLRFYRALEQSIKLIKNKFPLFLLWVLGGFVLLSILDAILLAIMPHIYAEYLLLLINSMIIMPFLTVVQTQIYISKYSLLRY